MDVVDLDERIKVGAVFGEGGRLQPVWFAQGGRRFAIERVTYTRQERDGAVKVYHYAVKVGATIYELAFDSGALAWRLARSYVE